MKKFVAFLLALSMMLSLAACGGSSTTDSTTSESTTTASTEEGKSESATVTSENAISDLVTYETTAREIESWNILYSQVATDFNVTTNLVDGLLSADTEGELVPGLAESWETTDNGLTWTFHLREGLKWVNQDGEEMADLTAADFVTGLEWVLNAAKNQASNTSMPTEMIVGAQDYYDYTAALSEDEAMALAPDNETFMEMVGIETPDDYTIVYTCVAEKPYFDTVATYACLYPASAALIDELGVEGFRGVTPETMWYCGPYLISEFISGNEKVYVPNPSWWGADTNTRFDSVTVKMVDDTNVAYQLYQTGEIDNVDLTESNLKTIYDDESNEFNSYLVEKRATKYAYDIHFCYEQLDKDGNPVTNWNTAVANEAFRLAWYYGLDMTSFYQRYNAVNPLKCESNTYTMPGLCYTTDGTDYADLVVAALGLGESDGTTPVKLNTDLAAEYKAQAMEELSAQGVTFPITATYYVASNNQSTIDTAEVLKQIFSDCLGDDFVVLDIQTYSSSLAKEVRTPQLASFYINGWGADYGDPQNYLFQETYGDPNAYYSAAYSKANNLTSETAPELVATYEEFTAMVAAANEIVDDLDARYEAYAEAEAYMIQHALVVPLYLDVEWELTNINDYSKINAMFGIQNNRYVNWETNSNGYTTEDYEAFAAE
jgi:oligopeptide transport system substrate-binding protein